MLQRNLTHARASRERRALAWPAPVQEVRYVTPSTDGMPQPMLFYAPSAADGPRPLLVVLHAWSENYMGPPEDAEAANRLAICAS